MNDPFRDALQAELESLRAAERLRTLEGPPAVERAREFTSNDTLSLSDRPEVVRAARAAAAEHGAGGRASRLLGGGAPTDRAAERAVADWLRDEEALLFPSGFAANLGLVCSLADRRDALVCDELLHASLVDAARLSRARVHVVPHGDLAAVEAALSRERGARRRLVLTEGVFSMDGDRADLPGLLAAADRHDAGLVVDEAHSLGLVGPEGAGAVADVWPALSDALRARLVARVVTGGKALGVAGGLVVGRAELRALLLNRARSLVYTTAVPPAVSGALVAAVAAARAADAARARVAGHARRLATALGLPMPAAAIVPLVLGRESAALAAASRLREQGFDVRAVRPPTVPEGSSRLRLVLHAHNTEQAVEELAAALSPLVAAAPQAVRPALAPRAPTRLLVVVGTDTGVGKTVVAAALAAGLARLAPGRVGYWKPVQTGDDCDTATVTGLLGERAAQVRILAPRHRFALPASPHEAAAAEGLQVDVPALAARLAALRAGAEPGLTLLVVEQAGGLLVPLDAEATQAELLAGARAAVVLVARSGLGTLNHTLLTAEALAARGIVPSALVLVGPPHVSNRETLRARLAPALLLELPPIARLDAAGLAAWADAQPLATLLPDRPSDGPDLSSP